MPTKNPTIRREIVSRYYGNNKERVCERGRRTRLELKIKVLTHYGKGHLGCIWPDCPITDPDLLTLDHIDGGGTRHRKEIGGGGYVTHLWIRRNDFPPGFQTLCWNHQWKKHIMGKRK